MGYFGYFPPHMLDDEMHPVPIVKKVNRIRCDGCGKYMKLDNTYLVVDSSNLRSHMKEECLTKVREKAKERRGEFEFAALGAKLYGKV